MEKGFSGALVRHVLIMGIYILLGEIVGRIGDDEVIITIPWMLICIVVGVKIIRSKPYVGESHEPSGWLVLMHRMPGIFLLVYTAVGILTYVFAMIYFFSK